MPYSLVLTKNGPSEEVTAVPQGWMPGGNLYWPSSSKKSDIESLRSNENSVPDKTWKLNKFKLILGGITSFKEALQLEDLYSKFLDTGGEEMCLNELENTNKQTDNDDQLLDIKLEIVENNVEDMVEPDENTLKGTKNEATEEVKLLSSDYVDTNQDNKQFNLKHIENISSVTDEIISLKASELLKVVKENRSLQTENMALKKELQCSVEFRVETKKNFASMQSQLDKIIHLLQNRNQAISSNIVNDEPGTSEDGFDKRLIGNIKFPMETKEDLDALEYKLLKKDVRTYLIRKFSETCGTSGIAKISKIGLPLMKRFIKDELLNLFTWKGIKGSTKMAFVQYIKIRELFYEVARLADKSCSFSDSDSFIQNSAIKHSGQRLKRQMSSSKSKTNAKAMKRKIEKNTSSKIIPDAEIYDEIEMNEETRDSEKYELEDNEDSTNDNYK